MPRRLLLAALTGVGALAAPSESGAKTPTAIEIVGSTTVAEGSAEPFFARVTFADATSAVVTPAWTNGFSGAVASTRIFRLAAPAVTTDLAGTLSVSYTEDGETVGDTHQVTVLDSPLTGASALEAIRRHPEPRRESRAGHSVDAATGAHIFKKPVLSFRATVEQALVLNYHSRLIADGGVLGPGWSHNYDLRISGDPQDELLFHRGEQTATRFRYLETIGETDHYVPLDFANRNDVLTHEVSGGQGFNLVTADGLRLDFDRDGLMVDFRNKVRQGAVLGYLTDSQLASVRESLSLRGFSFAYDEAGRITTVTDSTDRIVRFRYGGAGRLIAVTEPYYVDAPTYNNGAVFEDGVTVPDNDSAGAVSIIMVNRTEPIGEVIFNYGDIDYNRFADLVISLISPAGTEAIIRDHEALAGGASRFSLNDLSLGDFQGENPQGEWKLKVVDDVAGGSAFDAEVSPYSIQFSGPTNPTFYAYDADDRLIEGRDAVGARLFANSYDSEGRIATQDDGIDTNALARFTYEELGDSTIRTTYVDREEQASVFIHDAQYRLLSWTDPGGATTTFAYDGEGQRTGITDPLGRTVALEYDAAGNVAALVDAAGITTRMFYDDNRNLVRIRDALGKETVFEYDSVNNMTKVTDAAGNTLVKTYNLRSQLLSTELHDGSKIDFGYDGAGDLSYATHPVNAAQRAETDFDDLGRVIAVTDSSKYITRFEYSPAGQVVRELDPLGNEILRTYDVRGRITSETDKKGQFTTYTYDGNGNRIQVTDRAGNVTAYAYDGEDRLMSETDPLGRVTTHDYDARGRKVSTTDPLGRTYGFSYDAVGNLVAETDPSGVAVVARTYDANDLPTSLSDAFGHTVNYDYDALGRLAKVTDPQGGVTTHTYDDLDRLSSVLDPLNRVARKHYAPDDMTTRIETPGAADAIFEYDEANRLTRILKGTFQWREYFYEDYRDLVTREHTPTNLGIDYEYDGLGRLLVLSGAGGRIDYTYDDNGNMVTSEGVAGPITRGFDILDRVISYTGVDGNTIGYTYDAVGNLTRLTYPGGDAVDYDYDAADRLVRVTDWAGRETTFTYDFNDRITRITFPNGTIRSMTYDRAGQVTRRVDTSPDGSIVVGYEIEYDAAGQVVAQYPLHAVDSYVPPVVTMAYNDRYQVQTYNGSSISYSGDGQPHQAPGDDGLVDLLFLTNGTLYRIDGDTYEYDHEDRLVAIINGAGTTSLVTNPHAGLSQVLQKTDPDSTATRFVYGVGLLYDVSGDSLRVFHYDNRGNTVALTGNAGGVVHRFAYGPFGEPMEGGDPSITPFLFAGLYGVYTEPHGLCNMRSRWYSPQLRRFLSRDSYLGDVRIPTTLNPWAYGLNNPLGFDDPEGEFINIVVGAVAGAIGGVAAQGISDLIQGREPQWQDYVGAAAGGAVTGALIGSGFGVVFAGAAGGAVTNLATQGLNLATGEQEQFDVVSLGVDTAIGGAAGAAGGKAAKLKQAVIGPAWRKAVVHKGLLYSSKAALRKGPARQIATTVVSRVLVRGVAGGIVKGTIEHTGSRFSVGRPTVTAADRSRQRYQAVRAYVEQNLRERKGEYVHFDLYRQALGLADLPLPATPNNTLTEY